MAGRTGEALEMRRSHPVVGAIRLVRFLRRGLAKRVPGGFGPDLGTLRSLREELR